MATMTISPVKVTSANITDATAAGRAIITAASATAQRALLGSDLIQPVVGTNLTDANQTLTVAGGNFYTQATALTASRTKTLGTTGSPEFGEVITIARTDAAAFTLIVVNGGPVGDTLYTFPVSVKRKVTFQWNGTDWLLGGVERLA